MTATAGRASMSTLGRLKELLHPDLSKYGRELRESLYHEATFPLFVALICMVMMTSDLLLFTFLEDFRSHVLDEYFEYALGLLILITGLHFILRNRKFDYFALFGIIVLIATVAIVGDMQRIISNDNRYGVLIVAFLFLGMLFMPYRPYVALLLGLYCTLVVIVLRFYHLGPNMHIIRANIGQAELFLAAYTLQYFFFGLIAAIFRSIKMRFYLSSYLKDKRLIMAEEDLRATTSLLLKSESRLVEFKSSARWDYRQNKLNRELENAVVKTVAGFMNSEGGTLIIGVDDEGRVLGLAPDLRTLNRNDRDGYEQYLINLISAQLGKEQCVNLRISFLDQEGKDICILRIAPNSKPVFAVKMGNAFFIRTGNNTQMLDTREALEYIQKHFQI